MDNRPIGVFDSGIGGLTVFREIMRQAPDEQLIYFGDTARLPYGSKSPATIQSFVGQIISFLRTKDVKAIVVACNTASAYALPEIEDRLDIPIIGVVKPGAAAAAQATQTGRIGVIATEGTIASGMYEKSIRQLLPDAQVYGKACPLFVPLVEEGWADDPVTQQVIQRYLRDVLTHDIDTLILGCTHYPLLRKAIAAQVGEGITLVNPAYETAVRLKQMLEDKDLSAGHAGGREHAFYVSDGADKFSAFADSILPCDIYEAQVVDIESY